MKGFMLRFFNKYKSLGSNQGRWGKRDV